jgi:hypothetical protein
MPTVRKPASKPSATPSSSARKPSGAKSSAKTSTAKTAAAAKSVDRKAEVTKRAAGDSAASRGAAKPATAARKTSTGKPMSGSASPRKSAAKSAPAARSATDRAGTVTARKPKGDQALSGAAARSGGKSTGAKRAIAKPVAAGGERATAASRKETTQRGVHAQARPGRAKASADSGHSATAERGGRRKLSASIAPDPVASSGKRAVSPKRAPTTEATVVEHISPAEAVAHIQELLQAKRERVRQGPGWPGAGTAHAPRHGGDAHAHPSSALSSEAAFSHTMAHQRGEQSKRKG